MESDDPQSVQSTNNSGERYNASYTEAATMQQQQSAALQEQQSAVIQQQQSAALQEQQSAVMQQQQSTALQKQQSAALQEQQSAVMQQQQSAALQEQQSAVMQQQQTVAMHQTDPVETNLGQASKHTCGTADNVKSFGRTEGEGEQLEAAHVYLLLKKDLRISRNLRAEWYLEHLNKVIRVSRRTNFVSRLSSHMLN